MGYLLVHIWISLLLAALLGAALMSIVSRERSRHLQREFELLWKRWREEADSRTSRLYVDLKQAEKTIARMEAQLRELNPEQQDEAPRATTAPRSRPANV